LHDGLLHRVGWDHQYAYFSQQFRVVRFDRPGYGDSPPPQHNYSNVQDLKALFDKLQIERAILLGGSKGGEIALDFALACPDYTAGLVLVGPAISGYPFSRHMFTRGMRWPQAPENRQEWLEFWCGDPWLLAEESGPARNRLRQILTASQHNLEFYEFEAIKEGEAVPRLGEISAPTLVVVGESDIADIHARAGVIETCLPVVERVVMTYAGHLAYLEKPEEFNRIIEEFLIRNYWLEG
jgi:pimeloyl-ACP methyl ester carboxylesterase